MLADQLGQTAPLGQRQHRRQPRARHQIRVIERSVLDMAGLASRNALQLGRICPLARHILPGQKGIRALRPAFSNNHDGGSRLNKPPGVRGIG